MLSRSRGGGRVRAHTALHWAALPTWMAAVEVWAATARGLRQAVLWEHRVWAATRAQGGLPALLMQVLVSSC